MSGSDCIVAKSKSELLHGTLEMLVLQTLAQQGPMHGYAIGQRIEEMTNRILQIEQGSLYPALYRMQQRGWLESRWQKSELNRRAKFYELTRDGRERLSTEISGWTEFAAAVGRIVPDPQA